MPQIEIADMSSVFLDLFFRVSIGFPDFLEILAPVFYIVLLASDSENSFLGPIQGMF